MLKLEQGQLQKLRNWWLNYMLGPILLHYVNLDLEEVSSIYLALSECKIYLDV